MPPVPAILAPMPLNSSVVACESTLGPMMLKIVEPIANRNTTMSAALNRPMKRIMRFIVPLKSFALAPGIMRPWCPPPGPRRRRGSAPLAAAATCSMAYADATRRAARSSEVVPGAPKGTVWGCMAAAVAVSAAGSSPARLRWARSPAALILPLALMRHHLPSAPPPRAANTRSPGTPRTIPSARHACPCRPCAPPRAR